SRQLRFFVGTNRRTEEPKGMLHAFDDLDAEEVEAESDGAGGEFAEEKTAGFKRVGFSAEDGAVFEESGIGFGEVEEASGQVVRHGFGFDLGEGFWEAKELEGEGPLGGVGDRD